MRRAVGAAGLGLRPRRQTPLAQVWQAHPLHPRRNDGPVSPRNVSPFSFTSWRPPLPFRTATTHPPHQSAFPTHPTPAPATTSRPPSAAAPAACSPPRSTRCGLPTPGPTSTSRASGVGTAPAPAQNILRDSNIGHADGRAGHFARAALAKLPTPAHPGPTPHRSFPPNTPHFRRHHPAQRLRRCARPAHGPLPHLPGALCCRLPTATTAHSVAQLWPSLSLLLLSPPQSAGPTPALRTLQVPMARGPRAR